MGVTSISVSVRGKDTYFTGDAELYRHPDVMSVSFWLLYLDLNISIGFELNEFNPSTVGIKRLTAYKLQSWRKIPIRKFQRYVLDAMIPSEATPLNWWVKPRFHWGNMERAADIICCFEYLYLLKHATCSNVAPVESGLELWESHYCGT